MDRRDAIIRDKNDKRLESKNDIPRNWKNTWGRIFPDEEDGPVVDIESLELDNRQAPEHLEIFADALHSKGV
jgi:hypothetical protein